jgi:ABC-type multidrug transport system permease subunit
LRLADIIERVKKARLESFEVGPSSAMRRLVGRAAYVGFFLAVLSAFVYLFFLLTLNWQIALGSAGTLLGYMLLMAWWTERNATGRDDAMR